jgi:hypothetical protein
VSSTSAPHRTAHRKQPLQAQQRLWPICASPLLLEHCLGPVCSLTCNTNSCNLCSAEQQWGLQTTLTTAHTPSNPGLAQPGGSYMVYQGVVTLFPH